MFPQLDNPKDEATLVIGAFRYYLGQQSYAVSDFCVLLIQVWTSLSGRTKALLQQELEKEFQKDDQARENGDRYCPLGMDMDRREWEKVRDYIRSHP